MTVCLGRHAYPCLTLLFACCHFFCSSCTSLLSACTVFCTKRVRARTHTHIYLYTSIDAHIPHRNALPDTHMHIYAPHREALTHTPTHTHTDTHTHTSRRKALPETHLNAAAVAPILLGARCYVNWPHLQVSMYRLLKVRKRCHCRWSVNILFSASCQSCGDGYAYC